MTFKLSELVKLPEKKEQKILTSSGYMDSDLSIGYNYALSDLANMDVEVDEEAIRKNNQLICDNKAGDCFRACLTSILCIDNSPDLPNVDKKDWWILWHNFLEPKGLTLSYEKEACWKMGYWIATVKSKNFDGESHSIIMKGQEVYFDPSPKETYEVGLNLLGKAIVDGGTFLEVSDMSKFINWAIASQLPKW